jgi:hypothetical protein
MSFADISRLALQVREILPDASYETIQHHIRHSSTLDIDTVIASILDAGAEQPTASSTSESSQSAAAAAYARTNSTPQLSHQPPSGRVLQTSKSVGGRLSHKSYEEKKFELLNETRKRYLAKQNISP